MFCLCIPCIYYKYESFTAPALLVAGSVQSVLTKASSQAVPNTIIQSIDESVRICASPRMTSELNRTIDAETVAPVLNCSIFHVTYVSMSELPLKQQPGNQLSSGIVRGV